MNMNATSTAAGSDFEISSLRANANEELARAQREQLLQAKLADDIAKFKAYQANRWRIINEKLDSVHVNRDHFSEIIYLFSSYVIWNVSNSKPKQDETSGGGGGDLLETIKWSNLTSGAGSGKDIGGGVARGGGGGVGSITLSVLDNKTRPEFKYKGPKEAQDLVVAMYDYKAQRGDELDLSAGDELLVLVRENNAWWMGELVASKQQGYFPASYVQDKTALGGGGGGDAQTRHKNVTFNPVKMPSKTTQVQSFDLTSYLTYLDSFE